MSPQKFARTSTAKLQPPVCIGDVPSNDFSVSLEEKTDSVVKRLREDVSLPGVILCDEQGFVGMIPRQTIFERLGRRYGIELFLNKEINSLYRELHAPKPLIIDGEVRVEDAVQKALGRDEVQLYHPVVVFHAGTRHSDQLRTSGGRVLGVTAIGESLQETLDRAYEAIRYIKFKGMQYRKDIGAKAIAMGF